MATDKSGRRVHRVPSITPTLCQFKGASPDPSFWLGPRRYPPHAFATFPQPRSYPVNRGRRLRRSTFARLRALTILTMALALTMAFAFTMASGGLPAAGGDAGPLPAGGLAAG